MSFQYEINVELAADAVLPQRGSEGAAGYDLYACINTETANQVIDTQPVITILPGSRVLVPTGVKMAIPPGRYGRVAPRSGLANRYGIDVLAGVIDSDYRGYIGVILLNTGSEIYTVRHGDRIAQIIIETHDTPLMTVMSLDSTSRGNSGFGSTGS